MQLNALESRNNPDTETLSLIYLPNQARWKVQPPTEVTKSPTDANNSTQSPFKANNLRQSPVKASYSRQSPVEANVSIQSYSKGNARVEIPRPISSFLVKSQIGGGGGRVSQPLHAPASWATSAFLKALLFLLYTIVAILFRDHRAASQRHECQQSSQKHKHPV